MVPYLTLTVRINHKSSLWRCDLKIDALLISQTEKAVIYIKRVVLYIYATRDNLI